MASILTNTSAIAALQVLRDTSADLTKTQRQISSGLRIANSSDNAAYWSIATAMRSENKGNHTVSDAIALGRAIVDVAYTGMEQVLELLDTTKSHLVLAKGMPGLAAGALFNAFESSALGKIDAEITQLALSAWSVAKSSGFNGVNLLVNEYDTNKSEYVDPQFIVGYTPENGLIQVDVDLEKTTLFNANYYNFALPTTGLLDRAIGYKYNASQTLPYHIGFPTILYASGNTKPLDNYGLIFQMEYTGVNSGVFDRSYAYETAVSSLDDTIQQLQTIWLTSAPCRAACNLKTSSIKNALTL
jgi:flagellin